MKVDMAVQKTFFNKINSLVPLEKKKQFLEYINHIVYLGFLKSTHKKSIYEIKIEL